MAEREDGTGVDGAGMLPDPLTERQMRAAQMLADGVTMGGFLLQPVLLDGAQRNALGVPVSNPETGDTGTLICALLPTDEEADRLQPFPMPEGANVVPMQVVPSAIRVQRQEERRRAAGITAGGLIVPPARGPRS